MQGFRIPLAYDTQSPFLHHSVNGKPGNSFNHESLVTFAWSTSFLGKLLHQSNVIEIGPRGVRFITQRQALKSGWVERSNNCTPSNVALCQVETMEGWILPSEGAWQPPQFNITANGSLLEDHVMRLFADETACHDEKVGSGRNYYSDPGGGGNLGSKGSTYTVTSCDVLQGRLIVAYVKPDQSLFVYTQTFGPIAYLLILFSATISTAAIAHLNQKAPSPSCQGNNDATKMDHPHVLLNDNTNHMQKAMTITVSIDTSSGANYGKKEAPPQQGDMTISILDSFYANCTLFIFNINTLSSILVCGCIFLRNKVHFHILEDAVVFWVAVCSGFLYAVMALFLLKKPLLLPLATAEKLSLQIDSCMYSLQTISIALYRTPETPYASIIIFFMAYRIWEKVFRLCHGRAIASSNSSTLLLLWQCSDVAVALLNFNLMCEVGMKHQYLFPNVWPLYLMLILFLTHCLVKYQWMMSIIVF